MNVNTIIPQSTSVRRRQIASQLFHTAAIRVLSMGARAVTFALVVRLLSPGGYGWYALINTTIYISVGLATLNLNSYLIRELPNREEGTQYAILRGLLGPLLIVNAVVAGLVATLGEVFVPSGRAYLIPVVALVYLFGVANDLTENFFLGCKRIRNANWMTAGRAISMAALLTVLAMSGLRSLEATVGALLGAEVFAFLLAARWLHWSLFWRAMAPQGLWRQSLAYSLPLLAASLGFMMMKFGDKYLIARYLSVVDVARYTFAYSLVNMAYGLTVLVSNSVLVPHIMGAENDSDLRERNRQIVRATKLGVYGLLVFALVYAVFPARLWVLFTGHSEYVGVKGLTLVLAVASLLSVAGNPASFVLLAKRRTAVLGSIDVAGVVLLAALNILLLPAMGLYGAGLGAAISFGVTSASKHLVVWREKLFDSRILMDLSDEKWVLNRMVRFDS